MESTAIQINHAENDDSIERLSSHIMPSILLKSTTPGHKTRGYRSIRIKSTRVVEDTLERRDRSSRIIEDPNPDSSGCCFCFFPKKPQQQVAVADYWQHEIVDRVNEITLLNKDIDWLRAFQTRLKPVFQMDAR